MCVHPLFFPPTTMDAVGSSETVLSITSNKDVDNNVASTTASTETTWSDIGDATPAVDLWVPNEIFQYVSQF